jgi:hypothetical protein
MEIRHKKLIHLRFGIILLLGIAIRLPFALSTNFPLNDGGLFLSMIQDIEVQGGAVPAFTTYNGLEIPFVYPPLAFYLVRLLTTLFPLSNIGLLTFLPTIFSCLTLFAFLLIAKQWLKRDRERLVAMLLFAFIPRSFIWMVMGGGLTRSLGFVFALVTIAIGTKLYETGRTWYGILCAFTGALTVLSHLEMAWFAAITLGLVFALHGRHRRGIIHSAFVILLGILFTAPWWGFILLKHGPDPIVSAFLTGSAKWELWPPMLRYLMLSVLGILVCVRRKEYFLPIWLPLIFLLDPRSAQTVATVPLAILMSIGFWHVLYPSLIRLRKKSDHVLSEVAHTVDLAEIWPFNKFDVPTLPRTLDRMLLLYGIVALLSFGIDYLGAIAFHGILHALEEREVRMMTWIREEIPPDKTFLVLSGEYWTKDEVSEWFPALTGRRSLATVQGYEWTSASRFYEQWQAHTEAQRCVHQEDLACILQWQSQTGEKPDYLYYSTTRANLLGEGNCCEGVPEQLEESDQFELVHREGETFLFEYFP